jgi:hypothetical protein
MNASGSPGLSPTPSTTPSHPDLTEHTFPEMVRSRDFGILAGYEDQNDHDTLRSDPVFKLIADRYPKDGDLASQSTRSRFENASSIKLRPEPVPAAGHPLRGQRPVRDALPAARQCPRGSGGR